MVFYAAYLKRSIFYSNNIKRQYEKNSGRRNVAYGLRTIESLSSKALEAIHNWTAFISSHQRCVSYWRDSRTSGNDVASEGATRCFDKAQVVSVRSRVSARFFAFLTTVPPSLIALYTSFLSFFFFFSICAAAIGRVVLQRPKK